jgi:hypothetical protein
MKQWALDLDRLLRGDATRTSDLQQGTVRVQARGMLLSALVAGQIALIRGYAPLVRRNPVHRELLVAWLVLFTFIGIQLAWVLRPFIGSPGKPTQFFREGAWGNA